MDDAINNLLEALSFSPNNIPLKAHLANLLFNAKRLDEAKIQFQELIKLTPDSSYKLGLAKVFFSKKEFANCNVILEELLELGENNVEVYELYCKALIEENQYALAIKYYQELLSLVPNYTNEYLDSELRASNSIEQKEDLDLSDSFLSKPNLNFSHVGGLEDVKKEIDLKIIQPLLHPEIYKAYGKKIGGGILLFGPPGCGKTYIAKATAGQINAKFINISLNDILDMWIGNSEKNLHNIFELARKNKPCVLFFDEIDALGANRNDLKQSAGKNLINQFLLELDGVESNNDGILVIGATNTPWHLDTAFRRPGRFDRIIFVSPPDIEARENIFKLKLSDKPKEDINYKGLSKLTKDYSGADIEAIIDIAIEEKLEEAIAKGAPSPLTTKELKNAIRKHAPSTKEWFSTAKNYALYSNESGVYDKILNYLNISK